MFKGGGGGEIGMPLSLSLSSLRMRADFTLGGETIPMIPMLLLQSGACHSEIPHAELSRGGFDPFYASA